MRSEVNGTASQLLELLRWRYALEAPLGLRRTSAGSTSETWIVTAGNDRRVVVQRYPTDFDEPWIRFQQSILHHLRRHRFPTPGLMPTADGEWFVRWDGRYYAVFEYCQGRAIRWPLSRRLWVEVNAAAGRTLAWFHQLMAGFHPDGRAAARDFDAHSCSQELVRSCALVRGRRPLTRSDRYFLQQAEEIERRLVTIGIPFESRRAGCSHTVVHVDFGPGNVLFHQGRLAGVLDFTSARVDVRLRDVGKALLGFSKWFGPRLHLALAKSLLSAYQERYPLTTEELALLPRLMVYNRLEGLWRNLTQYHASGQAAYARWVEHNLELVRWMEAHDAQIQALCGKA